MKELHVLHKCNDISLAKYLAYMSWQPPTGKVIGAKEFFSLSRCPHFRVSELESFHDRVSSYVVCTCTCQGSFFIVQLLAVPVETEVRVYESDSWNCMMTLKDVHHKEVCIIMHVCVCVDIA